MATVDEWHQRWRDGRIGFHLPHVNPDLERWLPRLASAPTRVLVPLCGKTVDMTYLARQGHEVIGVELVEQAAVEYFREAGLTASSDAELGHPVYRGGGVELHVADMLRVSAEALGLIGAIYDRAALIALPSDVRPAYAERLVALLPPGCRMLLVTLAYDQARLDGPPFSVTDEEVQTLYGNAGELERLDHRATQDVPPRAAELGLEMSTSVWLFTRR